MWQNSEELMDYHEKETFHPFIKTELIAPEKGNMFSISVQPYDRKIVIFKQMEGSSMHGKPMIKMKTNYDAIFNKCLMEGRVEKKGAENVYCRSL